MLADDKAVGPANAQLATGAEAKAAIVSLIRKMLLCLHVF
jgi:hypothetical protein